MNSEVPRFSPWPRDRRRAIALLLLLGVLVAATLATMSVSADTTGVESSIVAADQLAAHGIELKPLPASAGAALVSPDAARDTARRFIGAKSTVAQ